ncbi:hypothetical protein [Pelagibius sp.]|uniref:hypothetical protein n=1 Tax=Pelagibius sp. TaxID=1931238 RepID=UPI003BB1F132
MYPFKTLCFSVGALAAGLAFSGPVLAQAQYSEYVDSIQLSRAEGIHIDVVLQNTSANKDLNAVNIQPKSNTLELDLFGHIKCSKDKKITSHKARAYFGPVNLVNDQINATTALYEDGAAFPGFILWTGNLNGWVTEANEDIPFSIPLAQIKQGSPAVRFDPVAELNKKLQTHLGEGKSKASFYQKEQFFTVQRPITLAGWCKRSPGVAKAGYRTVMMALTIRYEGDPEVKNTPVLSPKIGGQQPGQFQVGDQPFKITSMTFQPDMPHYVGGCPDEATIRVDYIGQGRGEIRIRVNDGGQTIYDSPKIAFDSKDGKQSHDFEIAVPKPPQHQLNQTKHHNLKVYVRGKGEDEQFWPAHYQQMDAALWKHRCTPVMNPVLGGANTGQKGGYQQGGNQAKPAVIPKLRLNTIPAKPRPQRAPVN